MRIDKRLLAASVLSISVSFSMAGQAPRAADIDVLGGYSIGAFTSGPEIAASIRYPFGGSLGAWSYLSFSGSDSVVGLEETHFSWNTQPYAAWTWTPGPFVLGLGVYVSLEYWYVDETIVDPAHGIDGSYKSEDFSLDAGIHAQALWRFLPPFGAGAGLHFSVLSPMASHLFLGASYAVPASRPLGR
jgi:hypothetical protein